MLKSWPYDSDDDARIIQGVDGREILQVRTPLGVEQYELDHRPDGLRPHGAESEFAFQLDRFEHSHAGKVAFELNSTDCAELIAESTIYYYRYLRLFQLKDWPRAIRDTARNLQVFDFVHQHARREEDRNYLEKWRPYLVRMHGAANALRQIEHGDHEPALATIARTIQAIEALEDLEDDTFDFERERSLQSLRDLARQIQSSRPVSKAERLEQQLQRAIEAQEFERAAELRDRLRLLKAKTVTP